MSSGVVWTRSGVETGVADCGCVAPVPVLSLRGVAGDALVGVFAGDALSILGVAAGGLSVVTAGAGSDGDVPTVPATAIPASNEALIAARTTSPSEIPDLFM
ncbi:hypothetical protein Harman_28570 [Haloarcula mannanilytica]|uniref:Uncharacterized protein n=1 Tax=Haloarcula mannanilytica TaxID=2509225 RepID=A0A4C2EKQ5_9EURY|nr:hypothetical protein Harman_28570 [Haloarcula mannanilytica]